MKLVKIEDGLLEQDDFFKVTPFTEFLGDFQYTRNDGVFTLKSGYIERRFEHEEYVVVVEKENTFLNSADSLYFYVRKDHQRSGLVEKKEDDFSSSSGYWKIIRHDGFIQSYISSNGKHWEHKGGGEIDATDVQGFQVEGNTPLVLNNYSVYRSPYLTINGFKQGNIAILLNEHDEIVKSAIFDSDGTARIFLDYALTGKLRFTDSLGNLIYESELINLKYGDVFANTSYELEVYYKGDLVTYDPTMLDTLKEVVVIKNVSDEIYETLYVRVIPFNTDEIFISLDNVNFSEGVIVPTIDPDEEVEVYILVKKDRTKLNYGTRHFALEID